MRHRFFFGLFLLALLSLGCELVQVIPQLPTEIQPAPGQEVVMAPAPTVPPGPTDTPTVTPIPTATPLPTATPHFLEQLRTSPSPSNQEEALPRHGLIITFLLPLLIFGLPWVILEIIIVNYVRPRGVDLSKVLIKAQDGLFIEAAVSMTARRALSLASSAISWSRVQNFVEKTIEQELIHAAMQFNTLDQLEQNLKLMSESFCRLPIVDELARDFGLEVIRFNIEIRYPQETIDALKRRAEASAGGTAYLAYAAAAHLDPDSDESRQLYKVFQETSSQVDAYRNLGSGLAGLASFIAPRKKEEREETNDDKAAGRS